MDFQKKVPFTRALTRSFFSGTTGNDICHGKGKRWFELKFYLKIRNRKGQNLQKFNRILEKDTHNIEGKKNHF